MQGLSLNELLILIVFVVCLVFIGAGAKAAWEDKAIWWAAFRARYTTATNASVAPSLSTLYDADEEADDTDDDYEELPVVGINPPDTGIGIGIVPFDADTVPDNLTYNEQVSILARQVAAAGKPLYSGKKIYALVGGNYNEFVALMRRLRPADDDSTAEAAPRIIPVRAPGPDGRMEERTMVL